MHIIFLPVHLLLLFPLNFNGALQAELFDQWVELPERLNILQFFLVQCHRFDEGQLQDTFSLNIFKEAMPALLPIHFVNLILLLRLLLLILTVFDELFIPHLLLFDFLVQNEVDIDVVSVDEHILQLLHRSDDGNILEG